MINLMIYINPRGNFDEGNESLIKIQIENSLDLGWKPDEILLITNFPFEYYGIKSMVIGDDTFCSHSPQSTKSVTLAFLLEQEGILSDNLYWVHDLDAFQVRKFTENEIGMKNFELGLTDYGWKPRWSLGSMFFKNKSRNASKVFAWIRNEIYNHNIDEEGALTLLTDKNYKNINNMYTKLNITFNFPACFSGRRRLNANYARTDKPIKVSHFRPTYMGQNFIEKNSNGNPPGMDMIPASLKKLFKKHLPELSQNI